MTAFSVETQEYDDEKSLQFTSNKKTVPIKKGDAQMLTRHDIQYDLLQHIFSDENRVFTDQTKRNTKATFRELYINVLCRSPKCSKVLKEKMHESPEFALEFAKISLLANVGRINTTMAFFPAMKTALRTYHPVPSLQRSDGNLQDAPRIKNCLKAALLPSEIETNPPTTITEVIDKLNAGQVPPTSVVNLVFILAAHAPLLGRMHFDAPLDFLDLFMPVSIRSTERARAFLWIIFRYLEDPTRGNPFSDPGRGNLDKVPPLIIRQSQEMKNENVDSTEEIDWGSRMCAERTTFLQKLVTAPGPDKKVKHAAQPSQVAEFSRRPRACRQVYQTFAQESFRHYEPNMNLSKETGQTQYIALAGRGGPIERPSDFVNDAEHERTMLQHAFEIASNTDPLADSDDEYDAHVGLDYSKRLLVLNRLRGKSPTPPLFSSGSMSMSLSHGC